MMIKRLPRYAEIELQRLCAKAGALCHAVDEDESGWDRLIEFPEKDFLGPADMRPPRTVAYAQVKSVENGPPVCRVKLSNALRAAQSPQPWFIVLVTGETCKQPSRVFAVHVWDGLIRRTLEAVRRAHNDRRPLHKCSLTVRFRQEDEIGSRLVQWMQEAIDAARPDYETNKRTINKTVGYEEGCGTGILTVTAENEEEILRNFLGLGDGLHVTKFSFTPSRFGIALPAPAIDLSDGIVYIAPQSAGDVEIRLRSPISSRAIVLHGHAYGIGLPSVPDHQKRIRFSAGFMEILYGLDGKAEFNIHLDGGDKHSLATIEDCSMLNEWLTAGPVDLQVWAEGKRVVGGTVNCGDSPPQLNWSKLSSTLRLLRSIAGHQNPEMSLYDLRAASGLGTFSEIADAGSLRLEFAPLVNAPTESFAAVLYWFHVDVGEYAFYAMAEWPVIEDVTIDGGKRRVTALRGRIVESYILQNPSDAERTMMERDYRRYCDQLATGGLPLELGDLRVFISESFIPKIVNA
ncbi:hypothetical protein FW320_20715 [Azospirillum sp. Vi22]|uniref:hypothetical protein n=1 Tax=Azospirillum baldaniorum TaxID=1064539 RepID=UPI00157A4852|nr:hypothetical protein [Azospirillum baldaniorum]NUB08591.1 hypothetical protein [Azospirillum baldaniorum]